MLTRRCRLTSLERMEKINYSTLISAGRKCVWIETGLCFWGPSSFRLLRQQIPAVSGAGSKCSKHLDFNGHRTS